MHVRYANSVPVLALLLAGCGAGTVGTAPASCRGHQGFAAEVDGDGRRDVAFLAEVGTETVLGVCTGSGGYAQLAVGGMGEAFQVADLDRDGRDELLPGGTTVSALAAEVVRYDAGELRPVRTADGERFLLTFGATETDGGEIVVEERWGCHPERNEVVRVRVDWRRSTTRTETYALRGPTAVRTSVTTTASPAGRRQEGYADGLVTPCAGPR